MSAYSDLMAYQRETEALAEIAGRLAWDQETVMPRGAAPQRADEMAAIESILHERRMNPRVGEWLAAVEGDAALGEVENAQIRHIRRTYERTSRVPMQLAAEIARTTSRAQGAWAEARGASDFAAFALTLETVVELKRREAEALSDGGSLYDALLDDYEPGATTQFLDDLFGAMRPRLVALREKVLGSDRRPKVLSGDFEERAQLALSSELALAFGYDLAHGRIDKAVHPFSSGSGLDVRITTRTQPHDPFNCFYSTIHEVGHATYEQGVDDVYALTPVGRGVSMGVHESQSRIYENQLGRSRAFTAFLYGRMRQAFGSFGIVRFRRVLRCRQSRAPRIHPHRGGRGSLQPTRPDAVRPRAGDDFGRSCRSGSSVSVERAVRARLRRGGRQRCERLSSGRALVGRALWLLSDLHARQRVCRMLARGATTGPSRS